MRVIVCSALMVLSAASAARARRNSGELIFSPSAPRLGQTISVIYRPAIALAANRRLVLRAHYRRPTDPGSNVAPLAGNGMTVVNAATLERQSGGSFTGSFSLPDSTVYAVFAVEDAAGRIVDSNGGLFWDLLVHAADGRPMFIALEQRIHDLLERDAIRNRANALELVKLYPERARSWTWLRLSEGWVFGADKADSLNVERRRTFAELERRFPIDAPLALDDLGSMAYLALLNRTADSAATIRWEERLLREAPTSPVGLDRRMGRSVQRAGRQYQLALPTIDTLWNEAGNNLYPEMFSRSMAHVLGAYGMRAAQYSGDAEALLRWTTRYAAMGRYTRRRMALEYMLPVPALREEAIGWLRDELRVLGRLRPDQRVLGETTPEQRARHETEARPLYAALGKALIATGHRKAGLDTLALADIGGWDLELFRVSAAAWLAAGDTARALVSYAKVAVDPRTKQASIDSMTTLARGTIGAARWTQQLAAARAELPQRALAGRPPVPLAAKPAFTDLSGARKDFAQLTGGAVTLVTYWSRYCKEAVDELPAIDSLSSRLARIGVRTVAVNEEVPSADLRAWIDNKHLTLPIYNQLENGMSRAFNAHAFPTYWLVDGAGRIRYTMGSGNGPKVLDDLLLQATALLAEGRPVRQVASPRNKR